MKKHLFLALAFVFAGTAHAQLVVDSLGRVGVGTETPNSDFQVGGGGSSAAKVSVYAKKTYGLSVSNHPSEDIERSASVEVYEVSRSKTGVGVDVSAIGLKRDSTSTVIGLRGRAKGYGTAVGVMGILGSSDVRNYAGIYGAVSQFSFPVFKYPGLYAGYFLGPVLATGKIYGSVYSLATAPKSSASANVQMLGLDSEESISDKLLSVPTIQFVREEEVEPAASEAKEMDSSENVMGHDVAPYSTESASDAVESETKTEMVRRYGLDGEQLKAVFPELVVEDSQGNYRINYSEMVPLLLQSIRELKAEVDELKGNKGVVVQKSKAMAMPMSVDEAGAATDVVRMSQNKPNPFSESSVIKLNVPDGTKAACIYIYDLSGKQVKSIPVDQRGETDITVYASDLQEGMFVYSLVVDGTVAATRRMMVVRN